MKKMMKKVLTLLLAAALTAALGLTAFAADGTAAKSSPAGTFTIKKTYTSTDGKTYPAETLTFTVTPNSKNPDSTKTITVGNDSNSYTVAALTSDITVSYPAYTEPGIYRYTIKENTGTSQGVTYDTAEINVAILVYFDTDGSLKAQAGVEKADPDAEKEDTFTNIYEFGGDEKGDGSLSVKKTVTGKLGDPDKYFTIKVSFTAENGKTVNSDIAVSGGSETSNPTTVAAPWSGTKDVTIKLKHDETIKFDKIPVGVTYTVEEDASHIAAGSTQTIEELNGEEGYLVSYDAETGTIAKGSQLLTTVTNDKDTSINTGISLDSLPYLLMLAAVAVGAVVIFRRRRVED